MFRVVGQRESMIENIEETPECEERTKPRAGDTDLKLEG